MSVVLMYGGKSPKARTVLMYGNCQSPFLGQMLGAVGGLNDDYRFVYQTNHALPGQDIPEVPDEYLQDVALLLEQYDDRTAFPVRERMRERLPPGCPTIVYPSFWMSCMWPFDCPEPRNQPEERFPWGRYPYGDAIARHIATQGLSRTAAVDAYFELSAKSMPDLQVRLQRDIDRMQGYDRHCDIKLTEYVLDRFTREQLFWTWGHTSSAPLAELALRLWQAAEPVIGGTETEARRGIAEIAGTFDGIGDLQVPIHPIVASTFGLEFCSDERRYRWFDQRWTFREYIERYIAYDTGW